MKYLFYTSYFKNIFLIILMVLFTQNIRAQDFQPSFWSHVQYGGGLGLSFGSGYFSGTIAPSAIYRFNDQFGAGVGLNLTYNTEKNFYESVVVGTSFIGLFNVIPQLQLSAEFEQLYVNRNWDERTTPYLDENYWYPGLYLGAGFHSRNVTMGVRYDILYNSSKSIYANPYVPFVRFYF